MYRSVDLPKVFQQFLKRSARQPLRLELGAMARTARPARSLGGSRTSATVDIRTDDEELVDLNSPLFYSEGHRVSLPSTPKSAATPRRPMRHTVAHLSGGRTGSTTPSGSPKSKGGASPKGKVEAFDVRPEKVESFDVLPVPTGSFNSDIEAADLAALYAEREEQMDSPKPRNSQVSASPRSAAKKTLKGAGQGQFARQVSFMEDGTLPCEESRPSSSMSMRGALFHSEGDIPLPRSPKNGRAPARPMRAVTEGQMLRPRTSGGGTPQGTPRLSSRGKVDTADLPPVSSCSFNSDGSDRDVFSSMGEGMDSVKESPRSPSKKFLADPVMLVTRFVTGKEPFLDWLPEFWDRVLTAPCPAACKTLALRSLANWVAIYNRWQAVGEWKPGQAPRFFNAFEAQQMLGIPLPRVMDFVKLFDRPGYARASQTKSPQDYVRIKLPVSPLITVCILMSTAICKKQKIRFLLGILEEEFVEMLLALFRGMAAMFNLLNMKEEEDPEIFEDEDQKFRLSHTAPVDLPLETAASLDATFLNRHELVVAHKLFNYCLSTGGFGVSHSAAEAAIGPIDAELWIDKLHRALDATEDARGVGRTTFTSFLKRLCPKATARHLRMFHSWLKEHQHLEELQSEVSKTRLKLLEGDAFFVEGC
eukprot:s424_g12.t1